MFPYSSDEKGSICLLKTCDNESSRPVFDFPLSDASNFVGGRAFPSFSFVSSCPVIFINFCICSV